MDFEVAKEKLRLLNKKIVFPEGDDLRIIKASSRLQKDGIAQCILLGDITLISKMAKDNNVDLSNITIVDHLNDYRYQEYVDKMF